MIKPIALFSSDWHLCDKKPIARSEEPDWLEAQMRVVRQVVGFANKFDVPLVIAGDVWDVANKNSPELMNLLHKELVCMKDSVYACSGNHDQQLHNLNLKMETSYQTGALANCYFDMDNRKEVLGRSPVYFIPFYKELAKFLEIAKSKEAQESTIIVLHRLVYETPPYSGAEKEGSAEFICNLFPNAEIIFCGDNHNGFCYKSKTGQLLINCGALIRHHADMINYQPSVYLLGCDYERAHKFSYRKLDLDISLDKISDKHLAKSKTDAERNELFIRTVQEVQDISLSFDDVLKKLVKGKACEQYVLNKLEELNNAK